MRYNNLSDRNATKKRKSSSKLYISFLSQTILSVREEEFDHLKGEQNIGPNLQQQQKT